MRIVKHRLHEGINTITHFGTLKLKYLDYQDKKLMGWFCETSGTEPDEYQVYIAVTGETIPDDYNYVCSHQVAQAGGYYVVHAFD